MSWVHSKQGYYPAKATTHTGPDSHQSDSNQSRHDHLRQVGGATHLAEAAYGAPLAAFKAFSSIAAQLGSGGQANYAAANAVLDAFAHVQQGQVLRVSAQSTSSQLPSPAQPAQDTSVAIHILLQFLPAPLLPGPAGMILFCD